LEEAQMPYVNIKLAGTVTREQKKEIAKEITETLERVANKPKSYTYITFEEVPYEDWAIAGKLLDD
jgi:4-oxalocrotonate tautomerase